MGEWQSFINPKELKMDTVQLEDAIMRDPICAKIFGGVKAADKLPSYVSNSHKFYITNTQNLKEPGEHWVVIYSNMLPEFFDSCGQSPESYKKEFQYFLVNHGPNYIHNERRLQNIDSDVCGNFCLFYIYHRSRNISMKRILKMFTTDLESNDRLVTRFCSKVFKV